MRCSFFILFPVLLLASCKGNAQKMETCRSDNIIVTDSEVESNLNDRIRYFISLYSSQEKLEQMSGKTIDQIKSENREAIKQQLLAEKLHNK